MKNVYVYVSPQQMVTFWSRTFRPYARLVCVLRVHIRMIIFLRTGVSGVPVQPSETTGLSAGDASGTSPPESGDAVRPVGFRALQSSTVMARVVQNTMYASQSRFSGVTEVSVLG